MKWPKGVGVTVCAARRHGSYEYNKQPRYHTSVSCLIKTLKSSSITLFFSVMSSLPSASSNVSEIAVDEKSEQKDELVAMDNDAPTQDGKKDAQSPSEVLTSPEDHSKKFVSVPNLLYAGLGLEDKPRLFYRRTAFDTLVKFVDGMIRGNHIGLIDGLPGTGKSSTLWWALQQQKYANKEVVWVHLDRSGTMTNVVKTKGDNVELIPRSEYLQKTADILVIDGVNQLNFSTFMQILRDFCMNTCQDENKFGCRSAFLTMSNKIKREHSHTMKILEAQQKKGIGVAQYYCTQHSWTLEEYLAALMSPDGTASILFEQNIAVFKREWDIEEDDQAKKHNRNTADKKRRRDGKKKMSSIHQVITQKFAYSGGSARWMLELSTPEIDVAIRQCLRECRNLDDLMTFSLGPESTVAKTHMYFSSAEGMQTDQAVYFGDATVYSMVSERATVLAVKQHGRNGIKLLYQHAASLNNPSFLGWVVEADLMDRCTSGRLELRTRYGSVIIETQNGAPTEFDYDYLSSILEGAVAMEDGDAMDEEPEIISEMKKLVPGKGETRACKPTAWNQGGYDVVFITVSEHDEKRIVVRFGQVTKSDSHSLKLKFFAKFLEFLKAAHYTVDSVEIAFIVPLSKINNFEVRKGQVESSGWLAHHTRYGTPTTQNIEEMNANRWLQHKEHQYISVYGLDMRSMGYPENL